ncbi:MAG: GAF domain-containing protein, partial [Bacteroidota bacterium]
TEQEEKLYNALVSFLVKYLNVNQGALFLLDDNQEEPVLFRAASYAYGRRKYITDSFKLGEGLVGQVFLEQELIALSEMPENFVNITSGLGQAPPTFIVTCPLNYNNECYGVLELAAFRELEEYELQFIVKIGEQIGAAISKSKINSQTRRLLEEAQQQAEELRAQEEEMQQNLEELAATQEEMGRKEREYQQIIEELKQQLAS